MNTEWKTKLNADPIPWLLESNPWTRYRTMIDLLDYPVDNDDITDTLSNLVSHPQIQQLMDTAGQWFPQSVTRHNVPTLSHYTLATLVEFGLTVKHPLIKKLVDKVLMKWEDGAIAIRQTLPEKGNGFTKPDPNADEWHAMPCDSPLITSVLLEAGVNDNRLDKSISLIQKRWSDPNGWFCHFFFVEGQFKKMQIGCPMAGLLALHLFSRTAMTVPKDIILNAFAPLDFHFKSGKSLYFFGRSKKFWTLKYPFVWYNALYLADVLTRFEILKTKPMIKELIDWLLSQQNDEGRFKPTSMFMTYKGWDFANKKEPSPWMTMLCCRILKNYYEEKP